MAIKDERDQAAKDLIQLVLEFCKENHYCDDDGLVYTKHGWEQCGDPDGFHKLKSAAVGLQTLYNLNDCKDCDGMGFIISDLNRLPDGTATNWEYCKTCKGVVP